MAEINILIVVDTEQALIDNSLVKNLYMIDTNRYFGSYGESGMELTTMCKNNDIIIWRVVGIDPGSNVSISKFTGEEPHICNPQSQAENSYWQGTVNGKSGQKECYQMTLVFNDQHPLTWDPFIQIK
jgi:hypothetical protein